MAIRVSFDMTPVLGRRTGIGNVVSHLYESISQTTDTELLSYTLSYNARSLQDELPSNNIFINYPASIMTYLWKYTSICPLDKRMGDFDLWHATNYLAPPTNKPLLITIHDVTMLKYPELVPTKVRAIAPIIKKRLDSGTHIHVPAQAIKLDVLEHFGDHISDPSKVHVVPFSVPELISKPPTSATKKLVKGDPYILCIGTLEPRKNHARLIKAFGIVHKSNPNIRMLLVGADGPARAQVDSAMAILNPKARSRIVLTGPVNQADRTYLLKHSYLVAYPSLYEGFGLPLLEAMTMNSPIITSKEGSLEEVGGDSVHFVDAHSYDDIARGIIDILESDTLRTELVEAGKQRVKQFSWNTTAQALANVYNDIVEDKG